MTARVAVQAAGLGRSYGEERAVDGVDLEVHDGEVHALVGLNGAGKTTLMRMLLGMVKPDSGLARIRGTDVRTAGPAIWKDVGYQIEFPWAYPELTVRENLVAAALLHGVERARIDRDVAPLIERFGLGHWESRRARHLSLGNRQRLGLASSLIHRPSIVILDEPANALDPAGVVFIRDLLRDCARHGAAVLVSSHHLDQLARVADRITLLHRGRIVGSLDPDGVDLERQFFDAIHREDRKRGLA